MTPRCNGNSTAPAAIPRSAESVCPRNPRSPSPALQATWSAARHPGRFHGLGQHTTLSALESAIGALTDDDGFGVPPQRAPGRRRLRIDHQQDGRPLCQVVVPDWCTARSWPDHERHAPRRTGRNGRKRERCDSWRLDSEHPADWRLETLQRNSSAVAFNWMRRRVRRPYPCCQRLAT